MLLLTDQRPRQTMRREIVRVPAGFALPLGETVKNPFNLIVETGVRWHPDWDEPRVTVNGWRAMPYGGVVGFAGDVLSDCFGTLLDKRVAKLIMLHGAPYAPAYDKALGSLGLEAPKAKQAYADFILPEQYGAIH